MARVFLQVQTCPEGNQLSNLEARNLPLHSPSEPSQCESASILEKAFQLESFFIGLIIALSCHSVNLSLSLSALVEFCSNWICQSCNMYFSRQLNEFATIVLWMFLSCYMDLSKIAKNVLGSLSDQNITGSLPEKEVQIKRVTHFSRCLEVCIQ